jgi:hypothetical protein
MIAYLIAPTEQQGIDEALSRGWTGIARLRYVTERKDDIRIVSRATDMVPFGGHTPMIKGEHYGGEGLTEDQMVVWEKNRAEFDRFAVEGNGLWVKI